MFVASKALKTSGGAAAEAKTCVMVGDNYVENKSNTDAAFASDLVIHDVFSDVYLLCGPPGHTHNGIDRNHNTHNNSIGRSQSRHFNSPYPVFT